MRKKLELEDDRLIVTLRVSELKQIISDCVIKSLPPAPNPKEEDVVLNRRDVANLFGISLVTVHSWMKSGILPFYRINSKIFFKKSEVWSLLEKRTEKRKRK
jgi:predicted DNA-binding transcriptional regulator AlpA